MAQRVLFILLLYCTNVLCNQCLTENFEDGLDGFTSDKILCAGFSTFNVGNYTSLNLEGLNPKSAVFISPDASDSCVSSYTVPMVSGAVIEFNFYVAGLTITDYLTILVSQDGLNDAVVAVESINASNPTGWVALTINLNHQLEVFDGHITFMGRISEDAIILIDSFRYIAPDYDALLCEIYEDEIKVSMVDSTDTTLPPSITTSSIPETSITSSPVPETRITSSPVPETSLTSSSISETSITSSDIINETETTDPILETTNPTEATTSSVVETDQTTLDPNPTTDLNDEDSDCLTYSFENDFEILFSTEMDVCKGFTAWNMEHYNYTTTERPNGDSRTFIYPNEDLSCISSFLFPMEIRGIVELNVYMESNSEIMGSEQISVMVMEKIEDSFDVVTGTAGISSMDANYQDGWRTIRIQLFGTGSFNGYITMFGTAAENSTVLVDSFRYIPPTYDERLCYIYESNAPVETTVLPLIESCVSYSIEDDFNNRFTNSKPVCNGFAPWNLATYSSIGLEAENEESEYFISANQYSNCVSSFPFAMSPEGIIQVKVYMKPMNPMIDHIIVLAKKTAGNNGQDTVNGFVLHTPTNDDYEDGWQLLNVTLNDFGSFDGYVTFFGAASEGSTVLIDSFKYIPPYEEDC